MSQAERRAFICPPCHKPAKGDIGTVYVPSCFPLGRQTNASSTKLFREAQAGVPPSGDRYEYFVGIRYFRRLEGEPAKTEEGEDIWITTFVDLSEEVPGTVMEDVPFYKISCCIQCERRFVKIAERWIRGGRHSNI